MLFIVLGVEVFGMHCFWYVAAIITIYPERAVDLDQGGCIR
jgi:hypothetical protein